MDTSEIIDRAIKKFRKAAELGWRADFSSCLQEVIRGYETPEEAEARKWFRERALIVGHVRGALSNLQQGKIKKCERSLRCILENCSEWADHNGWEFR